MRRAAQALLLTVLFIAAAVHAGTEVPYLSGRVNDEAEILSPQTRRTLSERLKEHEDRTTDQVVVLTVRTLGGESIEEFATRVFDSWKLGQRGKDNGVLVIVVPDDRRMRIEVGYGLEERMTDLLAGRIIRNVMTPKFKAGDYDGGIEAGVDAVLAVLQNNDTTAIGSDDAAEPSGGPGAGLDMPDMPIPFRLLIGAFIFGIIGLFTFVGIMTPGMGWFLYFFLIPFWAVFPMVVVGTNIALVLLVLYIVGFPITKIIVSRKEWYKKAKEDLKKKGRASIGGFTFSSGGGGGGWSSGGGGGFSGGGGSSGGGGASGSW
jgi:uncharacterized protein